MGHIHDDKKAEMYKSAEALGITAYYTPLCQMNLMLRCMPMGSILQKILSCHTIARWPDIMPQTCCAPLKDTAGHDKVTNLKRCL